MCSDVHNSSSVGESVYGRRAGTMLEVFMEGTEAPKFSTTDFISPHATFFGAVRISRARRLTPTRSVSLVVCVSRLACVLNP